MYQITTRYIVQLNKSFTKDGYSALKLTKIMKLPDVTEQQGGIKVNVQLGENTKTKCENIRWSK